MALIVCLGVLAVLSALAASFAFNQRVELQAAYNYLMMSKAKWMAYGGIERAVAVYRNDTSSTSFMDSEFDSNMDFGDGELTVSYDIGDGLTGSFAIAIVNSAASLYDASGRIYINDMPGTGPGDSRMKLDEIIDSLDSAISGNPFQASGADVVNYRNTLPGGIFLTTRQIMDVPSLLDNGKTYDDIKAFITAFGLYYAEPATMGHAPININTAPYEVLVAVLDPIASLEAGEAETVATAIIEYRDGADDLDGTSDDNPFDGNDIVTGEAVDPNPQATNFLTDTEDNDGDGATDEAGEDRMFAGGALGELREFLVAQGTLDATEQADVIANADPLDSTKESTEFCFSSQFIEIASTGRVTRGSQVLAEVKLSRAFERQR